MGSRNTDCVARDRHGIQCERDKGHKGDHEYEGAYGGVYKWRAKVYPYMNIGAANRRIVQLEKELAAAQRIFTGRFPGEVVGKGRRR